MWEEIVYKLLKKLCILQTHKWQLQKLYFPQVWSRLGNFFTVSSSGNGKVFILMQLFTDNQTYIFSMKTLHKLYYKLVKQIQNSSCIHKHRRIWFIVACLLSYTRTAHQDQFTSSNIMTTGILLSHNLYYSYLLSMYVII